MSDKQNLTQIIRKDARGCFVESLWDAFSYGKAHLVFASYDMNRPAGQRQTNNIHIYLSMTELLELCRKERLFRHGDFRQRRTVVGCLRPRRRLL